MDEQVAGFGLCTMLVMTSELALWIQGVEDKMLRRLDEAWS